ncbi:hypothetical protein GGI21_000175 [Coemansia aciculifera]|nr:hypothetical protein GGI21_000175 [Coemansia aciculifera]
MSQFDNILAEYALSGNNSTTGLSGYCKVWTKLGTSDAKFKQAQDTIRDNLYFLPSMEYAKQLGLGTSIAHGQLYDAGIQHGVGNGPDGLGGMINGTNARVIADEAGDSGSTLVVNGFKVDEVVWLKKFLSVRANVLNNPQELPNKSGAWAKTQYRIASYQYAIDQREYNWTSSAIVLNNDGTPTTVTCSPSSSASTYSRQNIVHLGLLVIALLNLI